MINEANVEALMSSLSSQGLDIQSSVGIGNDGPYLELWLDTDPADVATIRMSGSWYWIYVTGDFINFRVNEDPSDAEVREILGRYVNIAVAYLRGRRTVIESRTFRIPSVKVDTDDGPVILNLSIGDTIRSIFRRR